MLDLASSMLAFYMTIRDDLPETCGPVHIVRRPGKTLLAVNPLYSRTEITACWIDNLSEDEAHELRRGWGVQSSTPPWMVTSDLCLLYVPPCHRLPGEVALQGGAELFRRHAAGALELELALLAYEQGRLEKGDLLAVIDAKASEVA